MNKTKKTSKEKIKDAFIELIQNKDIKEISIISLVKKAKVNRSTFYINYLDIYDLAEKIKEQMYYDVLKLYKEETIKQKHSYNYLKLFKHIKENQKYYNTMFKLNFDFLDYSDKIPNNKEAIRYLGTDKNIEYHIEFFKAGVTAIIKKWLLDGCKKTPEEMVEIIKLEYKGKNLNI